MTEQTIAHVDVTINSTTDTSLETGVKTLIADVRPNWNLENLRIKKFTEGMTNELYGVGERNGKETVLVRIYGEKTELIINRAEERINIQFLYKNGCAKPIYCTFNNGLCYGFQEGHVVGESAMREKHYAQLIATELARLHTLTIPDDYPKHDNRGSPFVSFDQLMTLLPEKLNNAEMNKVYQEQYPRTAELRAAVKQLEDIANGFKDSLVLCHHDLMNRNIVISPSGDKACFIDYEYAGLSYAPLDIAGHFLSYVGITEPNFELYPDKEHRCFFLRCYLKERKRFRGNHDDVTDEEVEVLNTQVHKMELMVLVYWSVWCALQQSISKIDYPYLESALMMMGAYEMYKEQFLAM